VPNAQDINLALISDIIDDQMGLVGMHANSGEMSSRKRAEWG